MGKDMIQFSAPRGNPFRKEILKCNKHEFNSAHLMIHDPETSEALWKDGIGSKELCTMVVHAAK